MSQPKDKMSEIDEHIIKRFDIQKRLGKGAYGIVWKAVDKKTKEIVAVKKIFDAFRNQTDAQRTFREIMFLQAFKHHPNIIKLHSIHRAANNKDIYLGFEYMETDLHNVIKRGNILKDVHKRYIMYQLLKATKYIHSGNVIHRDQKPSNVLLDTLCRCKIADFGLARSLTQSCDVGGGDTDPTLTDYVATRWYRAPEILIANRRYTKGIDMWSLGCILGEMLAGKPIFPGTSTVNQVEKIMATIPTPTSEDINAVCVSGVGSSMIKNASSSQKVPLHTILGSEVPADALDLVNQLLVFNPMKRLTAEEALEHQYVSRFHDPPEEVDMPSSVVIPLNDDVRLAVDDYRNKLYEIMSSHANSRLKSNGHNVSCVVKQTKSDNIKVDVRAKVYKDTEQYLRTHRYTKEKPCLAYSEPRLGQLQQAKFHPQHRFPTSLHQSSDPKLTKQYILFPEQHSVQKQHTFNELPARDKNLQRKKPSFHSRSNVYMSYNSYNPNHGIITQSALMELRAAGTR